MNHPRSRLTRMLSCLVTPAGIAVMLAWAEQAAANGSPEDASALKYWQSELAPASCPASVGQAVLGGVRTNEILPKAANAPMPAATSPGVSSSGVVPAPGKPARTLVPAFDIDAVVKVVNQRLRDAQARMTEDRKPGAGERNLSSQQRPGAENRGANDGDPALPAVGLCAPVEQEMVDAMRARPMVALAYVELANAAAAQAAEGRAKARLAFGDGKAGRAVDEEVRWVLRAVDATAPMALAAAEDAAAKAESLLGDWRNVAVAPDLSGDKKEGEMRAFAKVVNLAQANAEIAARAQVVLAAIEASPDSREGRIKSYDMLTFVSKHPDSGAVLGSGGAKLSSGTDGTEAKIRLQKSWFAGGQAGSWDVTLSAPAADKGNTTVASLDALNKSTTLGSSASIVTSSNKRLWSLVGVRGRRGFEDHTWVDDATLTKNEDKLLTYSIGGFSGFLVPGENPTTFFVKYDLERSYEDGDEAILCPQPPATGNTTCQSGPIGPPKKAWSRVASFEIRHTGRTPIFNTPYAIAPNFSYNLVKRQSGIALPIYLIGAEPDGDSPKKPSLNGGISLGWTGREHRCKTPPCQDESYSVGLFVGANFSLLGM